MISVGDCVKGALRRGIVKEIIGNEIMVRTHNGESPITKSYFKNKLTVISKEEFSTWMKNKGIVFFL